MGTKTLPRHARPLAVGRWAGRIAERGLARPPAGAGWLRRGPLADARALRRGTSADAVAARPDARPDPLLDPLAVTEHCFIGDQIRLPAARCDIVGCGAEFADLAALGEADNRARALAAGWYPDAFGRLVCPHCQQHHAMTGPQVPGPESDTGGAPTPAPVPPGPYRVADWLHVLAALASGSNGWRAPQPVTGRALGGNHPAGTQAGIAAPLPHGHDQDDHDRHDQHGHDRGAELNAPDAAAGPGSLQTGR